MCSLANKERFATLQSEYKKIKSKEKIKIIEVEGAIKTIEIPSE